MLSSPAEEVYACHPLPGIDWWLFKLERIEADRLQG